MHTNWALLCRKDRWFNLLWIFVSRFFDPPKEPNELFKKYVQISAQRAHHHKHKPVTDTPERHSFSNHHQHSSSKHKSPLERWVVIRFRSRTFKLAVYLNLLPIDCLLYASLSSNYVTFRKYRVFKHWIVYTNFFLLVFPALSTSYHPRCWLLLFINEFEMYKLIYHTLIWTIHWKMIFRLVDFEYEECGFAKRMFCNSNSLKIKTFNQIFKKEETKQNFTRLKSVEKDKQSN